MKRLTLLALGAVAILGLAALTAPASAQQAQGGMGMMDGMMNHGMMGGMGKAMQAFDTNADGTLSAEEVNAGIMGEIATYDTDKNGTLSLAEFEALHAAHTRTMMVRAFQMHDADGDGQVTEAEMTDMAIMMQAHMGGGMMGQGGMNNGMMGNN